MDGSPRHGDKAAKKGGKKGDKGEGKSAGKAEQPRVAAPRPSDRPRAAPPRGAAPPPGAATRVKSERSDRGRSEDQPGTREFDPMEDDDEEDARRAFGGDAEDGAALEANPVADPEDEI